jgi:hypothetical protein
MTLNLSDLFQAQSQFLSSLLVAADHMNTWNRHWLLALTLLPLELSFNSAKQPRRAQPGT